MKRIVDKSFTARAPVEATWNHLAEIEKWPSWAKHIHSVAKSPPGSLSLQSQGTIKLSNGLKMTFRMTEFVPQQHWKWVGSIAGAEIHYDHIFIERAAQQTTIRFVVDAEGWWVPLFGGIFGRVYRRNLNRAVPLLVQEIEAVASSQPWGQAGERRG